MEGILKYANKGITIANKVVCCVWGSMSGGGGREEGVVSYLCENSYYWILITNHIYKYNMHFSY